MSVWDLKVTLFIYISIGVCVAFYPRLLKDKLSIYIIAFWVLVVPLLTIIRIPVVSFIVIVALLLYIQRVFTPVQTLCIFIVLIAAVPGWFKFTLGAGSVDIFTFRYWKILIACLLLPMIPLVINSKLKFDTVDSFLLIFIGFLAFQFFFIETRFTILTSIRSLIDALLLHFVTYIVISRMICQYPREAMIYLSYGFILLGLILAGVFIFNQALNVDLYRVHSTAGNVYNAWRREYRGGFLRAEGPLAAETMGLVFAAAVGSLYFLKDLLKVGWSRVAAVLALFGLAMLTTGSRGVLFSFFIIFGFFFFLRSNLVIKIFLVLGGLALYFAITFGVPVFEDEHGTFDFRAQLFEASFRFVAEHPFGDIFYASHHYFDHLRRGATQFLDIVSVYLEYLLPYGYIGLFLYVTPYVLTMVQLLSVSVFTPGKAGIYGDAMKFYFSLLVGYLFMISTVSGIGLIDLFGVIFLAIGRGLILSAQKEQTA